MRNLLLRVVAPTFFTNFTLSLHLISPETCSIPYLIPLFFQRDCDRSDEWFDTNLQIATSTEGAGSKRLINFVVPPQNVSSANIRTTPNAWTHEPFCLESLEAQNGYCVYTNSGFASGRGISVIATPEVILDVLAAAVFQKHAHSQIEVSSEGGSRYVQQPISGSKGFGVVTSTGIKRGERLHTYTPLLAVQSPMMESMKERDQSDLLRIAVRRLPKKSQDLFMSQHALADKDQYIDRVNKNAFTFEIGRAVRLFHAALPETARFNHDCRPNLPIQSPEFVSPDVRNPPHKARHRNYKLMCVILKPSTRLRCNMADDSLMVPQLDLMPYQNFTERTRQLQEQWGFSCTCALCTSSVAALRVSDKRLAQIETLINELNVPYTEREPNPSKAEKLVKLHELEGLDGPIGVAQMYSALEYYQKGSKKRAKIWARKAEESLKLWIGMEHPYYESMVRMLDEE